jgi:FKBP-type peptidyl-prolyl cis-trans isomerase
MKNLSFNEYLAVAAGVVVIGGAFYLGSGRESDSVSLSSEAMEENSLNMLNVQDIINSAVEEGGLVAEDLKEGNGEQAVRGKLVTVHYTGRFLNGSTFDSSLSRGVPFQFILGSGQVIEGWEQGIEGMRVGGERLLVIPPELAYGDSARGPIPASSTLVFEVELLGVSAP